MNYSYKKGKPLRTLKPASPEVLFARFLQRQRPAPTRNQLATWELDGGQVNNIEEDFVIIAGYKCHNIFERTRARLVKLWRLLRMYYHHNRNTSQYAGS